MASTVKRNTGPCRAPRARAAAGAAAVARSVYTALRRRPPGEDVAWERTNHAGRVVLLLQGPAVTAALAAVPLADRALPGRLRAAAALAAVTAGSCGAYDDQVGSTERGIRAHLGALLTDGRVTSGTVKLAGVGAAGLLAGALLRDRPLDRVLTGVVVAGGAHAVNLLDLRPGRAAKAVLPVAAALAARRGHGGVLAAATAGAAAALLPEELDERCMLGDAGAHALGAVLGLAASAGARRPALAVQAAAVAALAAAEESSGSRAVARFCERQPWAARLDALGRRPPPGDPAAERAPRGPVRVGHAAGAAGPVRTTRPRPAG